MDKINAVLVVLNKDILMQSVNTLNFARANLVGVIVDGGNGKTVNVGDKKIPSFSFSRIKDIVDADQNFLWLISGFSNNVGDIWKMKKFLMDSGIEEDNIVNFEVLSHISANWIANLRYIEKYGADFFATGISYTEVGLNLNFIPDVKGVNLAGSNQDLYQGYLTAKHVFELVAPGTIKFVLIGLAPYSFRFDNAKAFSVCSRNFQYMFALNVEPENLHDALLKTLVSDRLKNILTGITAEQADLNFERFKVVHNSELPAQAVVNWETELDNLTKKFHSQTVERNFQILQAYIKLCLANGARPVGVVFPFAPKFVLIGLAPYSFRFAIRQLEAAYDFKCIDLFDLDLNYDCFYNTAHLNLKGSAQSSIFIPLQLYARNILSTENLCSLNYEYFLILSGMVSDETYNTFIESVFEKSVELIRRKDNIKVGFVLYDASMWSGDELYNYFAAEERFEPTIFLCLRIDYKNELIQKEHLHGAEQFKSRGLNVVTVREGDLSVPQQDLLIFLTPYFETMPAAFQLKNLTTKTLITYIPYAFDTAQRNLIFSHPLMIIAYRLFFPSELTFKMYKKNSSNGMSHGLYSGYPRLDIFFNDKADFHFDWKMARPDAKKIIYAPHWSINDGVRYATFQWNYKFMYEFAKAHPEISWVVKPHPNLLFSAVKEKIFPSTEAFEEYMQKWNDLPNAQVYTGAYYQSLFATSDGMIHDSGSFIAEYQYVDKPMIYLTRDTQKFNELGEEILTASYTVDGKDLGGIATMIQRVFIDGDDYKAAERREVFDKHLNYLKANGMLASEFIYKSLSEQFL